MFNEVLFHNSGQHFFADVDDDETGGFCHVCEAEHFVPVDPGSVADTFLQAEFSLHVTACVKEIENTTSASPRFPSCKDVALLGIPCPLFSNLNQKRKDVLFNPANECLGHLADYPST